MTATDPLILHRIYQNLDIGIIVTNKDKKIVFCNHWILEKSRLDLSSVENRDITDVFTEIKNTRLDSAINDAIKHSLPAIISNIFNPSPLPLYSDFDNNIRIYQNINILPIKNNNETFIIMQVTDVSASVQREKALEKQSLKRKKVEDELLKTLKQLQDASEIKNNFLASMSHEIRTPMNGIVGISGLLKKTTLTKEQDKYIETIDDSVNLLLTVINDILDFSKLESGKLSLSNISFEFDAITQSIIDLLKVNISKRNINISLNIAVELKKHFIGDDNRIKQILLNLISNAIKFTKDGDVSINFECLNLKTSSALIKVSIQDTGIGIEKNIRKTLFEKFTQADSSTTRKYGGTGLGLAICKHLIELMNGEIGVESTLNIGSTFWFTLELPFAEDNNSDKKMNTHNSDNSVKFDFSGTILLVDDVSVNRIVAQAMLEGIGFSVISATNGKEAYEKNQEQEFDLILMDCQMPVMDGFDATKKIRDLEGTSKHTPIIALTALAMKGDNERCIAAGMDDYISKPYTIETLSLVIQRCLNKLSSSV